MKKIPVGVIVFGLLIGLLAAGPLLAKDDFTGQTIHFNAADGLKVSADFYQSGQQQAPLIILFHQAGYSRGAYRPIAPRLNQLGYDVLALDQRSGGESRGIKNQTHLLAKKLAKATDYAAAIPDLEGALKYSKNTLKASEIIIWGSSYSAALVFYLAAEHPNEIKGLLAFSPGEYFKIGGNTISSYAKKVQCPVFITSARNEKTAWQGIYASVSAPKYFFLPGLAGKHGSKALWTNNPSHVEYWQALEKFLASLK